MALKYYFEYDNENGDFFRCEISRTDYEEEPIEIGGYCILDYPEVKSHFDVIRGSGLQLNLDATIGLSLTDLYNGDITQNSVILYKNGNVKFRGFVDPDGVYQDFVSDKWVITLDAVDGLGLLEDLAYVTADGLPYSGKQKDINVIVNCLRRTGISLPCKVSINTRYSDLDTTLCPLDNVYSNAERFYKDDGETISSCKEVLESVLGKYGAVITQHNDYWLIYVSSEMRINSSDRYFYEYNSAGVQTSSVSEYEFPITEIGSQINGRELYHVNENQRIEIVPGSGAFKLSYKYGFVNNVFSNPNFINNGTTLSGWNIISPTNVILDADNDPQPVFINANTGTFQAPVLESTDSISVTEGDVLNISVDHRDDISGVFSYLLSVTDGVDTFWFNGADWVNSSQNVRPSSGTTERVTYQVETTPVPISGTILFQFLNDTVRLYNASLSSTNNPNLIGEFHTSYTTFLKSKRALDTKEIDVGDNLSDIYTGSLYKNDADTNTSLWSNTVEDQGSLPILRHLSARILTYSKTNRQKFIGDVYGDLDPLALYTIDTIILPGFAELINFIPVRKTYNTKTNISSMVFLEVGFYLPAVPFYNYEFALDYGNTVKPTII